MDALRRDDLQRAQRTSPSDRARQALESMRLGIRLMRARIEREHPGADPREIDALLRRWLQRDA